ncbi:MAG: cytochrome c family protein [Planctomycetota bacterium]|nr:cytochrome c family protein [Planctomycetota bacterium]
MSIPKPVKGFVLLFAVLAALGALSLPGLNVERTVQADPKGIKYTGAGACAAAACHGSPTPKEAKATRHNENTIWSSKDRHAKAYTSLVKEESKKIGEALKIADVTKSERCLNCHGLSGIHVGESVHRVPIKAEEIVAKGYNVEDGVSCDACHGPAEKYLAPHQEAGWTDKQRAAGAMKLYDEWGLFDTKDLKMRANTCLSCHLKIDADMIQAGHPELPFELNVYSSDEEWIHWRDTKPWFGAKAWAMGQAISLREAAHQLSERVEQKAREDLIVDSYAQVIAHALMARQVAHSADKAAFDAMDKHLKDAHDNWKDPAKLAAAMKALAAAANGLGDTLDKAEVGEEQTKAWRLGVAAEGEVAGNVGFRAAEQLATSITSLSMVMDKQDKGDADQRAPTMDKVYEVLGTRADFDKKKFIPAAKTLPDYFKGGKSLPLPPGGPVAGGAAAPAEVASKPPRPRPKRRRKNPRR